MKNDDRIKELEKARLKLLAIEDSEEPLAVITMLIDLLKEGDNDQRKEDRAT